ncbi:hypothetical protein JTB14_015158 [Gonioctena quinquepunctata]|nr:hypothetical protein JTB14_015158 [Gonioctena quinquepunctata]
MGNLSSKDNCLVTDSTTNNAEGFMRQVAKFNSEESRHPEKIEDKLRNRKRLYPKDASTSSNNPYYGPACRKPDMSEEEIKGFIQDKDEIMNCTIED